MIFTRKFILLCFFSNSFNVRWTGTKKNNYNFSERNFLFVFLALISEISTVVLLLPFLGNYYVSSIGIILAVLLLVGYIYISNSDPGFLITKYNKTWLQLVEENRLNIREFCPYCKVEKTSETVKHCHVCGHCVDVFDHHCHWINNCVGEKNSGIFIVFLIILILNIIFNYCIAMTAFFFSIFNPDKNYEIYSTRILGLPYRGTAREYLSIIIMSISILFVVPIGYVLYNQIKNRRQREQKNAVNRSR